MKVPSDGTSNNCYKPVYDTNRLKIDKPDIIIILAWRFKRTNFAKIKENEIKMFSSYPIT